MSWEQLERPGPDSIGQIRPGVAVRLHPRPGGDVLDLALAGRTAVVEAVEQDIEGNVGVAVVVDDDPGRDLGFARQPGHCFFFSPSELEVLEPVEPGAGAPKILIAGIGNIFLGDDGFGVALAGRLARRALPPGVEVADFGIRGMDLAFALQEGYDVAILLDATPYGQAPGTLYLIEADLDDTPPPTPDAHAMDPVAVLSLVRSFGAAPPRTFVVGCEPSTHIPNAEEELVAALSEPVRAALAPAVRMVESLLEDLGTNRRLEVADR